MHSPLTYHSYMKPATSFQVPKMYNVVPINSVQGLNKKRKVRNLWRKLLKPSDSNGESDTDGEESFKFAANSSPFLAFWFCFWVLHLNHWTLITFFNGFLLLFFFLFSHYCITVFNVFHCKHCEVLDPPQYV